MSNEQLSAALWGALAIVVALMLEVSHRLGNRRPSDVVHVTPDVVVLEEPAEPDED